MMSLQSANVVFRLRINGKTMSMSTSTLTDAERIAREASSPTRIIEILDGVTGAVIERHPENSQKHA